MVHDHKWIRIFSNVKENHLNEILVFLSSLTMLWYTEDVSSSNFYKIKVCNLNNFCREKTGKLLNLISMCDKVC